VVLRGVHRCWLSLGRALGRVGVMVLAPQFGAAVAMLRLAWSDARSAGDFVLGPYGR
jgi:hypothetical protein